MFTCLLSSTSSHLQLHKIIQKKIIIIIVTHPSGGYEFCMRSQSIYPVVQSSHWHLEEKSSSLLLLIGSGCQPLSAAQKRHNNSVRLLFWDENFDGHLEVFGENMWWIHAYEWQLWLVCGARGLAAFIWL